MTEPVTFDVIGVPVPQGSKTAGVTKDGRPYLRESGDKQLRPWRRAVKLAAQSAADAYGIPHTGWLGAIGVVIEFRFDRPASVSVRERPRPSVPPDGDKLLRAVLDAMTGVIYNDDGQVTDYVVRKRYCEPGQYPGVHVSAMPVGRL